MTIQEAVKSGKPFRRIGEPKWYLLGGITGHLWVVNKNDTYDEDTGCGLDARMILATDWEIKE
jgi:hypothetical protein